MISNRQRIPERPPPAEERSRGGVKRYVRPMPTIVLKGYFVSLQPMRCSRRTFAARLIRYTYPGTETLKNKLGAKTHAELETHEVRFVAARALLREARSFSEGTAPLTKAVTAGMAVVDGAVDAALTCAEKLQRRKPVGVVGGQRSGAPSPRSWGLGKAPLYLGDQGFRFATAIHHAQLEQQRRDIARRMHGGAGDGAGQDLREPRDDRRQVRGDVVGRSGRFLFEMANEIFQRGNAGPAVFDATDMRGYLIFFIGHLRAAPDCQPKPSLRPPEPVHGRRRWHNRRPRNEDSNPGRCARQICGDGMAQNLAIIAAVQ